MRAEGEDMASSLMSIANCSFGFYVYGATKLTLLVHGEKSSWAPTTNWCFFLRKKSTNHKLKAKQT